MSSIFSFKQQFGDSEAKRSSLLLIFFRFRMSVFHPVFLARGVHHLERGRTLHILYLTFFLGKEGREGRCEGHWMGR